jgi:tRNA(Arg) A34 adenosine deaminase TadA
MARALEEARAAASAGEVPVGAVVLRGDTVVAVARNRMR